MIDVTPSSGWWAFERLQRSIQNQNHVDADALANDEALTDLLKDFRPNTPGSKEVRRRFSSLLRNRRRKYRNRNRVLGSVAPEVDRKRPGRFRNPLAAAEHNDLLQVCRSKVLLADWAVLNNLASGTSYAVIAASMGISKGRIRTQVCRVRATLRATISATDRAKRQKLHGHGTTLC